MGMRRHPRRDFAFVGVTPTQADVAYQPAAILNIKNAICARTQMLPAHVQHNFGRAVKFSGSAGHLRER